MSKPILILDDVHASYVKKDILRGVSFEVYSGEIMALLGGNGSGKSTTLKVIAGLLMPTRGRIIFCGKDITRATPRERQQLGMGFLLQGGRVFPNLTVEENLRVSHDHAHQNRGSTNKNGAGRPGEIFPELAAMHATRAGLLSGGQRQMLAIEMVMVQRPILGMLDEVSGALTEALAASLLAKFSKLAEMTACSILLVEQNAAAITKDLGRSLTFSDGIAASSAV